MTKLFRLDASIRTEKSVTRTVADAFETAAGPAFTGIVKRDVGLSPLPATTWRDVVLSLGAAPDQLSPAQREAQALATTLVDEVLSADSYLFAIPLYNFGVAQQAKAWIDVLMTDRRFLQGGGAIAGRRAWLVTARGGGYGPGTPRHGWDHSTPWLKRILTDNWGLDVEAVEIELTLADTMPQMEALRPLAAENLRNAIAAATQLGNALASGVPAADAA